MMRTTGAIIEAARGDPSVERERALVGHRIGHDIESIRPQIGG